MGLGAPMRWLWGLGLCLGLAAMTGAGRADTVTPQGTDAPEMPMCEHKPGPGMTLAESITRPAPRFPRDDLNTMSEGWVLLGLTIATDGTTRDIVVLDRTGSETIVKSAIDAVQTWRYKPATFNGKPINQYNVEISVLYRIDWDPRVVAHDGFVRRYNRGRNLLRNGKVAEAIAALEEVFATRLTHYEQSMLSLALATAYTEAGNEPRALFHIRHATMENGLFVNRKLSAPARRLQLQLEARNGNFQYVACAPSLAEPDAFSDDPEERAKVVAIVANVKAALVNPAPIAVQGRLAVNPWVQGDAVWDHPLLRRMFAFDAIKGVVKNLRLTCDNQIVETPVNETSQWTVPASAGACTLRVYGEDGATFHLVEEW